MRWRAEIQITAASESQTENIFDALRPVEAQWAMWNVCPDPDFLAELVDYWRHGYDWQRCQEAINRYPNYLVDIGPQRLHFIREPGTEVEGAPRPMPRATTGTATSSDVPASPSAAPRARISAIKVVASRANSAAL